MNHHNKAGAIVAFLLVGMIVTLSVVNRANAQDQSIKSRHQYETMQICSNEIKTGILTKCKKIQNKYNTEFLCSGSNCWVEVR